MKYIIYSKSTINFVDQYWIQVINFFKNCGWDTIIIENQNDINAKKFLKTDIIMFFISNGLFSIPNTEGFKIFWLCDMHNQSPTILNNISTADLIITPNSTTTIKKHKYMDNKKYITHGWGVKEVKSLFFNNNPIKKILISGRLSDYYPLRNIAAKQNKKLIDILNHPGYGVLKKEEIIGDSYILFLNKYLCCFCDASKLNIVLKKVYEILYSGSLLLADLNIKKDLEEIGIIENVHCILCNKNNIEEKMTYILNTENIDEINKIRKNGFNLATDNFTLDKHCNKINYSLKNYINI